MLHSANYVQKLMPVHLFEKWRHFVRPKTLLCFRVRLGLRSELGLVSGLGLTEIRFRSNVFSSKYSSLYYNFYTTTFILPFILQYNNFYFIDIIPVWYQGVPKIPYKEFAAKSIIIAWSYFSFQGI